MSITKEDIVEERAQTADLELDLVRDRLRRSATGRLGRAADIVAEFKTARMPDETYTEFRRAVDRASTEIKLDEILGKHQDRVTGPIQVREARVYGKNSPDSYFKDRMAAMDPADLSGAAERLRRYDVELAAEIRKGSKEGKRAERARREVWRQKDPAEHHRVEEHNLLQLRALATGGGATSTAPSGAASFVSPYFLLGQWAPYRGVHRTFADQLATAPLPPYGLEAYLPAFTSTTGVGQQTEGQAITETDPSTGFQSAQIVTVAGAVTATQQLHDRGWTGGGTFDTILFRQLQQQLDEQINKYALAQGLAGAATVTGQASFSIAGLYQDLAAGREKLTDTAGTRLRPTHLFTTSDFYSYVTRQVDSQQRPIVTPRFAPGFPLAEGDEQTKWSRFTGTVLPGGVLWFEDDSIPNVGTTTETQLVVSAPDEALVLLEGEPTLEVFPQTDAATLEVLIRLRAYVAVIPRYPSGTATISSAAYTTALV